MSIEVEPLTLRQLGKDIRKERLEKDGDASIGICGGEGVGKSDVQCQLGLAIDPKHFDVEQNIVYSPSHEMVREKIMNVLPPLSAFGIDEAITVAYKRLFQAKSQIFMNVAYTQCRDHNIASLFCMPDFFDFDKYWRDHRLCLWIQLLDRGHGVIFSKDWNPFTTDKWNIKYNEKFIIDAVGRKKVHEIMIEERISMLLRSKNCIGWFTWDAMKTSEDEILRNMWIRYKELKDAAKNSMEYQNNIMGWERKYRDINLKAIKMLYEKTPDITQAAIAKQLGVSIDFVNKALRASQSRRVDKA